MRLLRIYLKNFQNHKLSEIDCSQFRKVLIVGKNIKNELISNGVGKTTIFTAIEYVFFNEVHKTTLDKIVKDGTKKAIVEIDFELNNEIYRVYRHRTEGGVSDVQLYQKINDEWKNISQRTPSATDARIKELIKITHKAFIYSVLFRQADLTGLSSVTDAKKRKEILKEPLELGMYSKLEEIASNKTKPIKKEIEKLNNSISMLKNPTDDIESSEISLQQCHQQTETLQKEVENTQVLISDGQHKIDQLKLSLGSTDLDIHKKIDTSAKRIKELTSSKIDFDKRLLSISNQKNNISSELQTFTQKITEATEKLKEFESVEQKSIDDIKKDLKKISDNELKGCEIIAETKAELKSIKKTLPDSGVCPICLQDISEDHRHKIEEETKTQIEKVSKDLRALEEKMVKCRDKKAKIELELKTAEKNAKDILTYKNEVRMNETRITDKKSNLVKLEDDFSTYTKSIEDVSHKINEEESHLELLKQSAQESNVADINVKIFSLSNEIKNNKGKIDSLELNISKFKVQEGVLKERIEKRTADKILLQQFSDNLVSENGKLKILQMVVDAFSNKGIPAYIIQTIIEDLQFEVSSAIKEIRPELDIQIDQDLNIEYRRNGSLRDYNQLSLGQQVYLALAFKRGLSRVIQNRVGVDLKLLIFDELDAHLDDFGLEAFSEVIEKWQRDSCVFVITHSKYLKDKFSHAIQVIEEDDGASANVVTSW